MTVTVINAETVMKVVIMSKTEIDTMIVIEVA